MDQISLLIIAGVGICVVMTVISLTTVRKESSRQTKTEDQLGSTANFIWSSMVPNQQDELNKIHALQEQEAWVEEHFTLEERNSLSGEKILIALANKGWIKLGMGTFKRYAPAIGYSSNDTAIEPMSEEEENASDNKDVVESSDDIIEDKTETVYDEPENRNEITENDSQNENNTDNSCQNDDKSV